MEKPIIHFITGNSGKFATMKRYADAADINAIQKDLPLIEPQANTVEEISHSKAQQAFALLQKPLFVNDAGMYIDALNGFPGPYVKYAVQTIGVEGIQRLAEAMQDRCCRFVNTLTYIDDAGMKSFEGVTEGSLATEIDRNPKPLYFWSDMERIFIPEGRQKPFSAFTEEDFRDYYQEREPYNVFGQLMRWLKTRH